MFGFKAIERVMHRMESLFDQVRKGAWFRTPTPSTWCFKASTCSRRCSAASSRARPRGSRRCRSCARSNSPPRASTSRDASRRRRPRSRAPTPRLGRGRRPAERRAPRRRPGDGGGGGEGHGAGARRRRRAVHHPRRPRAPRRPRQPGRRAGHRPHALRQHRRGDPHHDPANQGRRAT